MPGRAVLPVELLLDELRDVLLDVELVQALRKRCDRMPLLEKFVQCLLDLLWIVPPIRWRHSMAALTVCSDRRIQCTVRSGFHYR